MHSEQKWHPFKTDFSAQGEWKRPNVTSLREKRFSKRPKMTKFKSYFHSAFNSSVKSCNFTASSFSDLLLSEIYSMTRGENFTSEIATNLCSLKHIPICVYTCDHKVGIGIKWDFGWLKFWCNSLITFETSHLFSEYRVLTVRAKHHNFHHHHQ